AGGWRRTSTPRRGPKTGPLPGELALIRDLLRDLTCLIRRGAMNLNNSRPHKVLNDLMEEAIRGDESGAVIPAPVVSLPGVLWPLDPQDAIPAPHIIGHRNDAVKPNGDPGNRTLVRDLNRQVSDNQGPRNNLYKRLEHELILPAGNLLRFRKLRSLPALCQALTHQSAPSTERLDRKSDV